MRATTDSGGEIIYDIEKKPGVSNLLTIYSAFSGIPIKKLENQYQNSGYGSFKKDLVDVVWNNIEPIQRRFNEIRNSKELKEVLQEGAEKAETIAEETIKRVKDRFGLGL